MVAFLHSSRPISQNIPNPLVPETPALPRNGTPAASLAELQHAINHFFETFHAAPALTTLNPFFGDLDFVMNVLLLYKHAKHHLAQFGVALE